MPLRTRLTEHGLYVTCVNEMSCNTRLCVQRVATNCNAAKRYCEAKSRHSPGKTKNPMVKPCGTLFAQLKMVKWLEMAPYNFGKVKIGDRDRKL